MDISFLTFDLIYVGAGFKPARIIIIDDKRNRHIQY